MIRAELKTKKNTEFKELKERKSAMNEWDVMSLRDRTKTQESVVSQTPQGDNVSKSQRQQLSRMQRAQDR